MRLALAAAALALCTLPAQAETRALLVGIDEYRDAPLAGAVNDAKGVAEALQAAGASDVRLLLNADASLGPLRRELGDLVDRAKSGDLVVIGFAGHGAREPWGPDHPPDVKEGELHEAFLLQDYRPLPANGPATPQRLAQYADRFSGREMQDWLKKLAEKGARTLFVADACHGGGLTRDVFDPSARKFASRGPIGPAAAGPAAEIAQPAPDLKAFAHFQSLPGVTFLGAANAAFRVDEIAVGSDPETPRGAMSYAFSQALGGLADLDGDGKVSRRELYQYLRAKVRLLTADRQNPELQPSEIVPGYDANVVVLDLARDLPKASRERAMAMRGAAPAKGVAPIWRPTDAARVRLYAPGIDLAPFDPRLEISLTDDPKFADVVFRARAAIATTGAGDLLASEISAADLPGVVARDATARRLARLAETRPWELRVVGGARLFRAGSIVTLDGRPNDGGPSAGRHALLVAISGTGEVNVVQPAEDGDATLAVDRAFDPLQVGPPYGADLAILIVSRNSLEPLAKALRALSGRRNPLAAAMLIERQADQDPDFAIGLAGVYTAP